MAPRLVMVCRLRRHAPWLLVASSEQFILVTLGRLPNMVEENNAHYVTLYAKCTCGILRIGLSGTSSSFEANLLPTHS